MIKKNIYSSFIKYLYESNLTQVQYRLVLYLLYNSDKSYKFITNNSFLIDTLGATKKTVIEAIKELLKKNIITKNNLQNGYELAVVFEPTPTPAEVAPAESVTKVKRPKKTQHEEAPAEPTPTPAEVVPAESVTKVKRPKKTQHEEAPAEPIPTPAEVVPAESVTKVKRSRKTKHEETSTEPTPAPAEEAPTEKPKRSRKPKKGKITKEK